MDYWTILLAIIVGLFAIYYFFIWENYFDKHGIPHRKPLLLLGNMGNVLLRRISFIDHIVAMYDINKEAKYVGFYDFNFPVIIIRDLELIKSIAVKNFDHFTDHRSFTDPELEPLFGNNLFSLRGDKWRSIRNLLTPAFTSSKMKAMFKLLTECADTFSNSLAKQCVDHSVQYDSKEIFTRYTNDAIATCAFGIAVDSMKDPNNEFYVNGRRATNFDGLKSLKFFAARSFPTLTKILGLKIIDVEVENFFFKLIRETIAARDEQGINRPDMIQLMMETRGNKDDSKTPELSIESMTSQAFIFFFGGFDSTATLMCFVAHQLAIFPDVQKKLQHEIDEVMENCNGEPTYEAVNNMEYLDAVVNETMRMYPAGAFIDRICTKSFELPPALPDSKPVMLKPGDNLWFGIWPLQRDAKYFPSPNEFDPERFLGDAKATFNSNAFLPFGIGPRMCIGNRFALLETKVLFLYLLAKFDITPGKKMILPMRLSKTTINLIAEGGFWVDLNLRNKTSSNLSNN